MHFQHRKQLTLACIAKYVGRSEIWTCAALSGQTHCNSQEADALLKCLEVDPELFDTMKTVLMEAPMRGPRFMTGINMTIDRGASVML